MRLEPSSSLPSTRQPSLIWQAISVRLEQSETEARRLRGEKDAAEAESARRAAELDAARSDVAALTSKLDEARQEAQAAARALEEAEARVAMTAKTAEEWKGKAGALAADCETLLSQMDRGARAQHATIRDSQSNVSARMERVLRGVELHEQSHRKAFHALEVVRHAAKDSSERAALMREQQLQQQQRSRSSASIAAANAAVAAGTR